MIGEGFEGILGDAKQGGNRGFSELYRDLSPSVLGFVRGQGVADPEDVLAEVMVSVARSITSFAGDEDSFRSWVFTIAYRRVADDRRRAFRRVREAPLERGSDSASGPTPEDEVLGGLDYGSLAVALSSLKPVQRDVLLLRVVAGLALVDVAAIVSKSEPAVKMIQVRALDQLRALLSPNVAPDDVICDSERR